MEKLGDRLRKRRKELKLTQKQVAKASGISPSSVTQWEAGDTAPKGENLYSVCKILQCSPDWLLYGKERPTPESNAEWIGGFDLWDSKTPLGPDEVEIPFFTEVQLAAGNGAAEAIENIGPKLRFAKSALIRNGTDSANAVCVKVSGNSMEPVIPDGATIGIDTAKVDIIDGKIFAINHDGMLRVKMLYRVPGGGMRLKSFNSDEHPEEIYTLDDSKHIRVIGKVFWYSVLL